LSKFKISLLLTVFWAAVFLAAAGRLCFKAFLDPEVPFLVKGGRARWITYPLEPDVSVRDGFYVGLETAFTRRFGYSGRRPVTLSVKALRKCHVWLNRRPVLQTDDDSNWKKKRSVDITKALKQGANTIEIIVSRSYGPPCLWALIEGADDVVPTDESWTAAFGDLPAAPASVADDTRLLALNETKPSPLEAFRDKSPLIALFFATSAVLFLFCRSAGRRSRLAAALLSPKAMLVTVMAAWAVVFTSNWMKAGFLLGFDVKAHIAYIEYLLENRCLPPVKAGWECHQPPLFYVLGAMVLAAARSALSGMQAILSVKIVPFLAGAGQAVLAYFASDRLFQGRRAAVTAAVIFTVLVPMNVYMSGYISNESPAGFTAGLCLVAALAVLGRDKAGPRHFAILGAAMGLAVLTKATGLVTAAAASAVVFYHLLCERPRRAIRILGCTAGTALVAAVFGGWFYMRNLAEHGTLVVLPWHGGIGYEWWQDPGFHTPGYFFQFGGVFAHPCFSSFYSFWDSIYATFWGDWLCGGMNGYDARPPWNYAWMAAVLPLAVPAVLFLAAGFCIALVKAFRGDRRRLLIAGTVAALGYSLLDLNLSVPYHGHAKAFFCLAGLIPAALLFAEGVTWLLSKLAGLERTVASAVFWGWLGALAFAVFAAFFLSAGEPQLYFHKAWALAKEGELEESLPFFEKTIRAAPDHGLAHGEMGVALARLERTEEALEQFAEAVRLRPENAEARVRLAVVLSRTGRNDEAFDHLRRAVELAPLDVRANLLFAQLLAVRGDTGEAARRYRMVLRIDPKNVRAAEGLKGISNSK